MWRQDLAILSPEGSRDSTFPLHVDPCSWVGCDALLLPKSIADFCLGMAEAHPWLRIRRASAKMSTRALNSIVLINKAPGRRRNTQQEVGPTKVD